ncbi:hypothetical protein C1645_826252 [Glomus cerebriforme]|uniref:Uncharacterized protein n=1 Tax=Glomus cerebriforme TaxID=658196 RepID=A0A397SXI2_9GLOM|nr:hypothetical protein C1645_826252 [Glomus cerebriforme]
MMLLQNYISQVNKDEKTFIIEDISSYIDKEEHRNQFKNLDEELKNYEIPSWNWIQLEGGAFLNWISAWTMKDDIFLELNFGLKEYLPGPEFQLGL